MIDQEAIEDARERDGAPSEDRPEEVDAFLEPSEEVGFNQGLELLDVPYSEYCEDVLRPEAGPHLATLVDHDMVGSIEDLARELGTTKSKVSKALELHDIEAPQGEGSTNPHGDLEDAIELPLMGVVGISLLRSPVHEDARLLEHCYVTCGMGIEEIQSVLEDSINAGRDGDQSRWRVRTADIRAALESVGLLEREKADDSNTVANDDERIGGVSLDFSVCDDTTVNVEPIHVNEV